MNLVHDGKWKKGRRIISGKWTYDWSSDKFFILLDEIDDITGEQKEVVAYGDLPEWGKWRLIEKDGKAYKN